MGFSDFFPVNSTVLIFLHNLTNNPVKGYMGIINKLKKRIKSPCQGAFFSHLSELLLILKLSLAFFRKANRQPNYLDSSLTGFSIAVPINRDELRVNNTSGLSPIFVKGRISSPLRCIIVSDCGATAKKNHLSHCPKLLVHQNRISPFRWMRGIRKKDYGFFGREIL